MSPPPPVPIKVCGLTRREDAELTASLGARALGCVLAPGTPRTVSPEAARALFQGLGDVEAVMVFREAGVDEVLRASDAARLDRVQLHRTPDAVATCLEDRGLRVVRVVSMPAPSGALDAAGATRPLLLDVGGGGTGRVFDWSLLDGRDLTYVAIAGGITPENLPTLLLGRRPGRGIDVSSGVEARPGVKSPERLRRLFSVAARVAAETRDA